MPPGVASAGPVRLVKPEASAMLTTMASSANFHGAFMQGPLLQICFAA
jgi:hypothetical protein